jgi:hypothetical protein
MRVCRMTIEGTAPYSQSYRHEAEKLSKETPDEYEKRTWREKCNATEDGYIYVPAMAFKQAFDNAAKIAGGKIPGKGQATYSKLFVTGVAFFDNLVLPHLKADAKAMKINANADGVRGSGKRVWRYFPFWMSWGGEIEAIVFDETIPNDVFERIAKHAGVSQGVGRFRPEKGGMNGRFKIVSFEWSDREL